MHDYSSFLKLARRCTDFPALDPAGMGFRSLPILLMTCPACACVSRTVVALCGMFQPPCSTSAESQSALAQTFRVLGRSLIRQSCTALIPVRVIFIRRGDGQHRNYGSRGLLKGLPLEEPTAAAGASHAQSDWVVVEQSDTFGSCTITPGTIKRREGSRLHTGTGMETQAQDTNTLVNTNRF